jgi:hypothetical protein
MLVCRLPYEGVKYGTLTIAGKQFSKNLQDNFVSVLNDDSFLFPSSIFLRPEEGCAQAACLIAGDNQVATTVCKGVKELCTVVCHDEGEFFIPDAYREHFGKYAEYFSRILDAYKRWIKSQFGNPYCIFFIPSGFDGISRTALLCPVILGGHITCEQLKSVYYRLWMLARTVGTICENHLTQLIELREKEGLFLANTHSAIGSIMSRNGSHNIGSHVLSALSHNVGTMPDDRVLYQYIQHRMDYIASATTGAPDWSVPTPFVGNLMKMFYSQRHLLDHIAESDGLHAYQYQGKGTQVGDLQHDCVRIITRKIERYKKEMAPTTQGREGWLRRECDDEDNPKATRIIDIYEFFSEKPENTVVWGNDEDMSIPGGILGQQAFYNIIENIIRNAAKHSWAGKSEKERKSAGNLEIYVDFELCPEDGTVRFTVGDNMSKLFSDTFWPEFFEKAKLPQEHESEDLAFVFAHPLDGEIVLPQMAPSPAETEAPNVSISEVNPEGAKKTSSRYAIEQFLAGKGGRDSLPWHYQVLYDYINAPENRDRLLADETFKSLLKGEKPTGEDENPLRGRLPLPLHHRQEIELAKPFIDPETNRLRQSSWGLSEMKISAGYLRRAKVSVIGGLESQEGEHPLIVPVGIPKTGQVGKLDYKELRLAYRFWIKIPKDVLIVADDPQEWEAFKSDAIEVESYATVMGDEEKQQKGKIGLMSDYNFVLVDHNEKIGDDVLKLPFRALRIDVDQELPCISRKVLSAAKTREEFVSQVYKVWLDYLKKRRGAGNEPLTIKLNIYEKSGGEKGLISDRDIYKVLFRECLHSVLEPITMDVEFGDLQRKALLLVSLYPLNEDDELFKDVDEEVRGNHQLRIEGLLGSIAQKVRHFLEALPGAQKKENGELQQRAAAYQAGLEQAMKSMRYPLIAKELLGELDSLRNKLGAQGNPLLLQELAAMAERPSESTIVDVAAKSLDVARTASDVFLRKYEERIATLPLQYKGGKKPKEPRLHFGFGVDIVCEGSIKAPDISYNRHATDDAKLYSEPLSGSQNYLNALSNLSADDAQWAMRLAENGLLRIAIIDERVRAFIAEHGEEIKRTYASMHIAVVDTSSLPPAIEADKAVFPNLMKWPFIVDSKEDDFDLVVIHQGIIDKWWPGKHGKDDVREILRTLRNPTGGGSRFVVVTTGRGRPDNIPDNEKVLAFSSIEAFLFKRYPEKLNLVNSLMNILPGSPERNDDND